MFRFIKKALILVLISTVNSLKCISLKNQECKVRKVIADNEYMAFPYKISVNKCVGSCNNISNPHSKVCILDIGKNVTVKMFDLINLENATKQCVCKINSSVCSKKQKFRKDKCLCEFLVNKKCQNDFVWIYSNCECECNKEAAKLIVEECEEITDTKQNKTISIIKNNRKL